MVVSSLGKVGAAKETRMTRIPRVKDCHGTGEQSSSNGCEVASINTNVEESSKVVN